MPHEQLIEEAFDALMGINGDRYVREIANNDRLSAKSYQEICDNVQYNSRESICKYFGVVQFYYAFNTSK